MHGCSFCWCKGSPLLLLPCKGDFFVCLNRKAAGVISESRHSLRGARVGVVFRMMKFLG